MFTSSENFARDKVRWEFERALGSVESLTNGVWGKRYRKKFNNEPPPYSLSLLNVLVLFMVRYTWN